MFFLTAPFLAFGAAVVPANTCKDALNYDYQTARWEYDCEGGCDSDACTKIQSGNPVGNVVPLSCGCPGGTPVFPACAAQVWVNTSTGVVTGAGCRVPDETCNMSWHCKSSLQPAPPEEPPAPTWYPCECKP